MYPKTLEHQVCCKRLILQNLNYLIEFEIKSANKRNIVRFKRNNFLLTVKYTITLTH